MQVSSYGQRRLIKMHGLHDRRYVSHVAVFFFVNVLNHHILSCFSEVSLYGGLLRPFSLFMISCTQLTD